MPEPTQQPGSCARWVSNRDRRGETDSGYGCIAGVRERSIRPKSGRHFSRSDLNSCIYLPSTALATAEDSISDPSPRGTGLKKANHKLPTPFRYYIGYAYQTPKRSEEFEV